MFNPKQALQRIRKQKIQQQQQSNNLSNSNYNNQYDRPLFPQSSKIPSQPFNNTSNDYSNNKKVKISQYQNQSKQLNNSYQPNNAFYKQVNQFQQKSLQQRMSKLQSLVSSLNQKLTVSNQTITQLKSQNSHLQAQILKLTHQNQQLKLQQRLQKQENKNLLLGRLNNSMNELVENHKNLSNLSLSKQKLNNQIKKQQAKPVQEQSFSQQVQQAIEEIRKQPLQNILKRRQHNFRALKNASKQTLMKGQKAIKQLANLHKQYGKYYKKPTLIINLTDQDFQ